MRASVKFTVSIDRDLLQRANVMAAKFNTSVNALLNAELRYLMETIETVDRSGHQNFRTLLNFSLGLIDDEQALAALGIDSREDLFLLMAQAHFPMPRLPMAMTQQMVASLHALTS